MDIMISHNIAYSEVYKSVWLVVDAVNQHPQFHIEYPHLHWKQRDIARNFQKRSKAGFGNCGGCIDGVLIWMEKPSERDCEEAGVASGKFFMGKRTTLLLLLRT